MKTDFDKEFKKMMTEEIEIPAHVRERLDNTYNIIEVKAKRKKNRFIWKRVAMAACALLITGALLTNEQVRASINDYFSFGDKGIEHAMSEGFAQENDSIATDQNVSITLKRNFGDANKIGMSFQLVFKDPAILKILEDGVINVSLAPRIKNGDGEYIAELISDSKTLKLSDDYVSGFNFQNPLIDVENGVVQYELILNSNEGEFPDLKDAIVEIESISIFSEYYNKALHEESGGPSFDLPITTIEGKWDLALANQDESKPISTIEYVMKDPSPDIQITSATANPTSLNLKFIVDRQPFGSEGQPMKIIDEEGNEYETGGYFTRGRKNNKMTVDVNFQLSSYNNAEKLKFIIEGVGEVELLKKK